jgi:hypothetical protein
MLVVILMTKMMADCNSGSEYVEALYEKDVVPINLELTLNDMSYQLSRATLLTLHINRLKPGFNFRPAVDIHILRSALVINFSYQYNIGGFFVEYLLLLWGWCATSLRPPTICAKSYKAYNVSTCYYRINSNRMACHSLAASNIGDLHWWPRNMSSDAKTLLKITDIDRGAQEQLLSALYHKPSPLVDRDGQILHKHS